MTDTIVFRNHAFFLKPSICNAMYYREVEVKRVFVKFQVFVFLYLQSSEGVCKF